jgi:hypothetical protein
MTSHAALLRALLQPHVIVRAIIRSLSLGSLEFRLAMQALEKAQYAFGIRQAIYLASRLKHSRVAVIEFGVGAGGGLKLMEQYAAELGRVYGVSVEVYGFDLGCGLPPSSDYRNLPYVWQAGDYAMQIQQVQQELKTARLLIGDVRETIPRFIQSSPAPVGFISFDLDYYSSTIAAFSIFNSPDELLLPRVLCYFDDVASDERQMHCEYAGELLAISEFNRQAASCHKLSHTYIHSPSLKLPGPWLDQLWVYHRFSHPEYNTYIRA